MTKYLTYHKKYTEFDEPYQLVLPLKVLPTGIGSGGGCFVTVSSSEAAPHKQRNKRDDKKTAG